MRMQLVKANGYMILDDSYKSNPESAKAAIDALESLPLSFRIACLADMLDLGPTENELHLQIGEYASTKNVDVLYGYGPLTKFTVQGFKGKEKAWFETKEEMIEALQKYKDQDCAILIKGSRAMAMDEVVSALKGE